MLTGFPEIVKANESDPGAQPAGPEKTDRIPAGKPRPGIDELHILPLCAIQIRLDRGTSTEYITWCFETEWRVIIRCKRQPV